MQKSGNISFGRIASIIGAVLIFVGAAWLVADNWSFFPKWLKIIVLLVSTSASYIFGHLLKQKNYTAAGRALLALGSLLVVLTLFQLSQIFNLPTSLSHYTLLLLISWIFITATAYLLDSKESLFISMVLFFFWTLIGYVSSTSEFAEPNFFFGHGFVAIFACAALLFYGSTMFHKSLSHQFENIYKFWGAFYVLALFYLLSFQIILGAFSFADFNTEIFTVFLSVFIAVSIIAFGILVFLTSRKSKLSKKELGIFLGILAVGLIFVFSANVFPPSSSAPGYCYEKSCYDFKTESECNTSPPNANCLWKPSLDNSGFACEFYSCYENSDEESCTSAPEKFNCVWEDTYCTQTLRAPADISQCYNFESEENCLVSDSCVWQTSSFDLFNLKNVNLSFKIFWLFSNLVFIGLILLVIWYGSQMGSTKIVNLGIGAFVLEIATRYIGFWIDYKGYFAFSILAILGGALIIALSWLVPKWRSRLINETKKHAR